MGQDDSEGETRCSKIEQVLFYLSEILHGGQKRSSTLRVSTLATLAIAA
jgi:hypothetical protein